MHKENGFTLIELLTVIVVLAIIAVIGVPLISGLLENSKRESFERSVEMLISATDLNLLSDIKEKNYVYTVIDGEIKNMEVPVQNAEGFYGKIVYDQKGKSIYAIHDDTWCMVKSGEGSIVVTDYEEGKCGLLFDDGLNVYYDVLSGEFCTNYHQDNSITGYNGTTSTKTKDKQNSCLKFYAFNDDQDDLTLSLILDHNTTDVTSWTKFQVASNANGPINVLEKLKANTDSWVGTLTPSNYTVTQSGYGNYTIPYSTEEYKARLITANEVAEILGKTTWNEATSSSDLNNLPSWLYDRTNNNCKTSGCLNNADSSTTGIGYWTATSSVKAENGAWRVTKDGNLYSYGVQYGIEFGVRPVIEILKENIK